MRPLHSWPVFSLVLIDKKIGEHFIHYSELPVHPHHRQENSPKPFEFNNFKLNLSNQSTSKEFLSRRIAVCMEEQHFSKTGSLG